MPIGAGESMELTSVVPTFRDSESSHVIVDYWSPGNESSYRSPLADLLTTRDRKMRV